MKKYIMLIVICSILFLGCSNEEPVKSKSRRRGRTKQTSAFTLDKKVLELEKRIEELTTKQNKIVEVIDDHTRSIYNNTDVIERKHPGTYNEWLDTTSKEDWVKSMWTEDDEN